jgi:hypothetical protein
MIKTASNELRVQYNLPKVAPDVLLALDSKLTEIARTMRENKTILAYEMIRTLQEFVAYERAKHSAQ